MSLSKGEFCKSQVVKKLKSDDDLIAPDHLLDSAYSSTTSFNTLLDESERFGRRDYLLKKLQIDESYLNEHRPLSVFACRNALDVMGPFFDEDALRYLGRNNARKFCLGPFGEAMTSFDSASNSLERFMANCKLIEKNWDYRLIKRKASSFVVESIESDLMKEHLKGETFTTESLNTWRWSFLEEVLRINSGRGATCVETKTAPGKSVVEVFIHSL